MESKTSMDKLIIYISYKSVTGLGSVCLCACLSHNRTQTLYVKRNSLLVLCVLIDNRLCLNLIKHEFDCVQLSLRLCSHFRVDLLL